MRRPRTPTPHGKETFNETPLLFWLLVLAVVATLDPKAFLLLEADELRG